MIWGFALHKIFASPDIGFFSMSCDVYRRAMRCIRTLMAIIKNNHVAEMQGLYGPFTMAERVVQKIWLQRDFDGQNAVLTDGRRVQIKSAGRWNLLGGPDFCGAKLVVGGNEITGDVEVHFHASDWRAHGHAADPAYDKVILHLVLFPLGADEKPAVNGKGETIPTLILLPLLHRDLEEYTSDDALEVITERDEWRFFAELAAQPTGDVQALLREKAQQRWLQKVYFAGVRIQKLGWEEALHHTALEILGYARNRAAMLAVASHHPLEMWRQEIDASQIFSANRPRWQLHGIRPANHPLRRLLQYQSWTKARPDWPRKIPTLFTDFPENVTAAMPTRQARQMLKLPERRRQLALEITNNAISGARFDNLICDGLLPLVSVNTKNDLFFAWFHWFMGDVPDQIRRMMPKLGISDGQMQPLCHGYARGLIGWFLECEARASG